MTIASLPPRARKVCLTASRAIARFRRSAWVPAGGWGIEQR